VHLDSKYGLGPFVSTLFSDAIVTELVTFLSDTIISERVNVKVLLVVLVLMRICGPKADGVTGGWRMINKEALYAVGDTE
jgi:hypothetical protein